MTARRGAAAAVVALALALAALGLLRAADPPPPSQREQVQAISETIRCPTCQGLSIADSSSVLAAGSRKIVEEQVAQGRTPDQVRQYFVDRYGEWILLSPRTDGTAVLVWVLPLLVVAGAGAAVWAGVRRRRAGAVAVSGDAGAAAEALADFRAGRLVPDASPAGEALREALHARVAAEPEPGALPDPDAVQVADARLAAAARRYGRRPAAARPDRSAARPLPRRAVTVLTALLLVAATGTALALGVRARGANDLPTGDLPGGVAGQTALSLEERLAATRERPGDPAAWTSLGETYEALEQYTRAVEAYDRALAVGGGDDAGLLRAGVLVRMGSPSEALPALQELAARRPDDPDVVLLLGLAQQATRAPEAPATLRRFLELAPDAPAATGVRELLGEG